MANPSEDQTAQIGAARKLLDDARNERASACLEEINRVLAAHNCRMEPQVTMRGQTMTWQLIVIPND